MRKKRHKTHIPAEEDTAKTLDSADGERETDEEASRCGKIKTDSSSEAAREAPALEELQERIASLEDSLLRARADQQNMKRRMQRESLDAVTFANAQLMRSLLEVLDDFERSLTASTSATDMHSVVEGVRLVYENMKKALQTSGLHEIEALDKPFDPNVHEAVMLRPSAEHPSGTVIEQVAQGFMLRDRVLRPAKVIVSQAVEQEAKEADAEPDK